MLRIYGDKAVKKEQERADKQCETLSPYMADYWRHLAECRAWAVHDSFFIWDRPLSNTFEELKGLAFRLHSPGATDRVFTWADLKAYVLRSATEFLARLPRPAFPSDLEGEYHTRWWQWMATAHQCYIETEGPFYYDTPSNGDQQ